MKTFLSLLLLVFSFTSLPLRAEITKEPDAKRKPAGVRYEGGDGSTMEKAVIIKGAKGSEDGIASEYSWVAKKYPGYKTRRQALLNNAGKSYDLLSITTKDGKELDIYFDITDFFGKF